jgi:DNA adenine methylase
VRPFLKWAGNKFQIIPALKTFLPTGKRLLEPFAGSAAVFLNTDYPRYLIAEINPDLIQLYEHVQKEGHDFIAYAEGFFIPENNEEKRYYELRECFNQTDDKRLKSALFIYLNKAGYNGLCRYNSKGGYNVPFGKHKSAYFPKDELIYFYEKSAKATFILADFKQTLKQAKPGDVVYCDPPYVPLSKTANFTTYSQGGFNEQAQRELAVVAEDLSTRGITVLISNHDTPFVRDLYQGAELHKIRVQRFISRDPKTRGNISEIVAIFHGKKKVNV